MFISFILSSLYFLDTNYVLPSREKFLPVDLGGEIFPNPPGMQGPVHQVEVRDPPVNNRRRPKERPQISDPSANPS